MIFRLLLLGTILCVTVLSVDESSHNVVKRQAFGQRGRFRLRPRLTTEEQDATEEKTAAPPPPPPPSFSTAAPRRSRLRIRLRPTTVAEPEEIQPPIQPAVRSSPQSAPPEEEEKEEEEEEEETDHETPTPRSDPPKPASPLTSKRPFPRFLPARPSLTTSTSAPPTIKEVTKPTVKVTDKQTEKPSSGHVLSSPFEGLSQPSPEDLQPAEPVVSPAPPPKPSNQRTRSTSDGAESDDLPPSRNPSTTNRRTATRFRSRPVPASRVPEPPQQRPVTQTGSRRTQSSRYRPPASSESLDYSDEEEELEPPVRSTSNRRSNTRGRQTLDPPQEETEEDDIPHRPLSSSRGRRPYRYRPRQPPDYDDEEPPPRRSQSTSRRRQQTRYRSRPASEDDRLDQVPASNRRAPSRARNPYVEEEPEYDDDYENLPPPPPPRRTQGFRSRSRPNYRPQSQYEPDDYPQEPPPRPRTTTTTTTTPAPRSNATVVPGKYHPRPDGRFIGYLSDPNYPRELVGVDLTNYPFYITVPDDIDFDCEDHHDGYYASVPHFCQVFHYCAYGTRYSFLCPNFTLYDQTTFTCRFVNHVDCEASPKHYSRNDDLYVETTTLSEDEEDSKKKRKN